MKKEIFSWVKSILLAVALVVICREFIFMPVTVDGESMLPTFEEKNKVVVSKLTSIDRFDMVVFDAPDDSVLYIKRVIGLPGDTIEVKDEVLYVNGKAYNEEYVNREYDGEIVTGDFTLEEMTGSTKVPEGSYFVMGDNRLRSKDSRTFGFISEETIEGEVKFRFFPFNEIGMPE